MVTVGIKKWWGWQTIECEKAYVETRYFPGAEEPSTHLVPYLAIFQGSRLTVIPNIEDKIWFIEKPPEQE